MDFEQLLSIASAGVQMAILVSAPVLLCGLAAGVLVSIFQAATQINDSALAFIPKIAASVFSLMYFGPWMLDKMSAFAIEAFNQIPAITN